MRHFTRNLLVAIFVAVTVASQAQMTGSGSGTGTGIATGSEDAFRSPTLYDVYNQVCLDIRSGRTPSMVTAITQPTTGGVMKLADHIRENWGQLQPGLQGGYYYLAGPVRCQKGYWHIEGRSLWMQATVVGGKPSSVDIVEGDIDMSFDSGTVIVGGEIFPPGPVDIVINHVMPGKGNCKETVRYLHSCNVHYLKYVDPQDPAYLKDIRSLHIYHELLLDYSYDKTEDFRMDLGGSLYAYGKIRNAGSGKTRCLLEFGWTGSAVSLMKGEVLLQDGSPCQVSVSKQWDSVTLMNGTSQVGTANGGCGKSAYFEGYFKPSDLSLYLTKVTGYEDVSEKYDAWGTVSFGASAGDGTYSYEHAFHREDRFYDFSGNVQNRSTTGIEWSNEKGTRTNGTGGDSASLFHYQDLGTRIHCGSGVYLPGPVTYLFLPDGTLVKTAPAPVAVMDKATIPALDEIKKQLGPDRVGFGQTLMMSCLQGLVINLDPREILTHIANAGKKILVVYGQQDDVLEKIMSECQDLIQWLANEGFDVQISQPQTVLEVKSLIPREYSAAIMIGHGESPSLPGIGIGDGTRLVPEHFSDIDGALEIHLCAILSCFQGSSTNTAAWSTALAGLKSPLIATSRIVSGTPFCEYEGFTYVGKLVNEFARKVDKAIGSP